MIDSGLYRTSTKNKENILAKLYVTTNELICLIKGNGSLSRINHLLLQAASDGQVLNMYAVPRGGIPVSYLYAKYFEGTNYKFVDDLDNTTDIIIDDLVDSGSTKSACMGISPNAEFFTPIDKQVDEKYKNKWIVFPWESTKYKDDSATDIVTRLLQYIGEDPTREGLLETPGRVVKAWGEWFKGYDYSEDDIAGTLKVFTDGAEGISGELVIVADIPFTSFCEHHIAMFTGVASIGYISDGKILGLSKFARLVEIFASRLQVQERLTAQIAQALVDNLSDDIIVVLDKTTHSCMCSRGVKSHGTNTITSAIRGKFRDNMALRSEFLSLIGRR